MSTRYNTGNPIESTDVRDMSDNAKNFDDFANSKSNEFTDRFGVERKTIHGMNSQFDSHILNMWLTRVGTFKVGATITNPRQTLLWDIADGGDGQEYGWSGAFPLTGKVVPAGSTPLTTGGVAVGAWMSRFDPALKVQVRESLRRSYAEAGYSLVNGSFEAGGTLVNANDVLLHEATGRAFSGIAGSYPPGTGTSGFTDVSKELLRIQLSAVSSQVLVGGQKASVLNQPYIITGRANLANPYWGAPKTDTMNPAAATANARAIQKMLNSGSRICELDEKPRYIVDTLTMASAGQIFCGQGKGVKSLEFRGGNIPVIARPNWADLNASGEPGMRVEHMLISDKSTGRTTAWSIDLTNGDSCGLEHVTLFGDDGTALSNNYGVALGTAFGGSSPAGPAFVCHIRHSRLSRAKVIINTTDSYVESNEMWGNKRDFALQLGGGGTFVTNNQIVPGELYGIYLNHVSGYMLDILRIIGNYFDGSYTEIFTGDGIYQSAASGGIFNSVIADNSLWNLNGRGMRIENVRNSRIVNNNFVDCASSDVSNRPDIYIGVMSGSKVDNTHYRSYVAPKTNSARVNLSPALQITANASSSALSEVYQIIGSPSTYLESQLANHHKIIDMGRILNRGVDPDYVQGAIMVKFGLPYIGAGGVWKAV